MNAPTTNHLKALLTDASREGFVWQVLALLTCLAAAWLLTWLLRRALNRDTTLADDSGSVLFGRNVIDGALFPLLSLCAVYVLRVTVFADPAFALLRVAVLMLLALAVIRLTARILRLAFPDSAAWHLVERFFSWVVWVGIGLWLVGVLPLVTRELDEVSFTMGKTKLSLLGLFEGVAAAALVIVLALWVSAVIERRLLRDAVTDLSLRKVATNAIRAVLLFVGLLMALSSLGVDLTALSVLGGALGVGLGFGLQKLAANYVSGFVILLERSLRIGDNVKVDGFEGRVTDIKTRYTMIRSVTGREAIVPNEKMITERVENLSLSDSKVQLNSVVTVGYDSDVEQVLQLLLQSANQCSRVLKDPAPTAHLVQFAPDGLEFNLGYWISDPENGQLNVKSDVHVAILQAFRAANIEIPYPQRVVHSRSS
jgi:small-conductance mechanosensitive channel